MTISKSARLGTAVLTAAAAHAAGSPGKHRCPAGYVCFWSGEGGTGPQRNFRVGEQPSCVDMGGSERLRRATTPTW